MQNYQDTIVALSTAPGQSAIAMIRLDGQRAFEIIDCFFKGKKMSEQVSHTIHFGKIIDGESIIDEVVVAIYKNPHSFTGNNCVEITCHGSRYIIEKLLYLACVKGARMAAAGEFTQRAFLNGKLDLSQAEAVADLIASESQAQHELALKQMRGNYSQTILNLRQELIDFAALMELELDFSEEDVEFADRTKFLKIIDTTENTLTKLIESFQLGNVIKNGIPVAIVGKPNVGKSTLLNILLQEEKAIVSNIAGTTRDYIEDTIFLKGIQFRFIDTAGLRQATDEIEAQGISRSYQKMEEASIVLFMAEISQDFTEIVADFKKLKISSNQKAIILLNKSDSFTSMCDAYDIEESLATLTGCVTLEISAKENRNIDKLINLLTDHVSWQANSNDLIVTNSRHVEAFKEASENLKFTKEGLLEQRSTEFVAIDLRAALQALGRVTGQISNEDILSSVFSRFCIGK